MTEAEFLTSTDPAAMLATLRSTTTGLCSDRKLRLFACACCRQPEVWNGIKCKRCGGSGSENVSKEPCSTAMMKCLECLGTRRVGGLFDPRSRQAVEVAERFADGGATLADLGDMSKELVRPPYLGTTGPANAVFWLTAPFIDSVIRNSPPSSGVPPATQAALLRCIFGNPFRPLSVRGKFAIPTAREDSWMEWDHETPKRWLTPTVRAVAASIYDCHAWGEMPILADALEEAGCTDAAVLMHLRGWVRCPACLGARLKSHEEEGPFGRGTVTETCHDCQGGWVRPRCPACGGSGLLVNHKPYAGLCPACKGTGHASTVHCRGDWALDLCLGKS